MTNVQQTAAAQALAGSKTLKEVKDELDRKIGSAKALKFAYESEVDPPQRKKKELAAREAGDEAAVLTLALSIQQKAGSDFQAAQDFVSGEGCLVGERDELVSSADKAVAELSRPGFFARVYAVF